MAQALTEYKWLFSPLLLVIVLLVDGRSFYQGWSINRQARVAVGLCLSPDQMVASSAETVDKAWFRAVVATCNGETAVAQTAMQEALATSPHYIDLVHALVPEDNTLASFAADHYPAEPQALFWLGDLLAGQGDADSAIVAYEQGLVGDRRNGLIWVRLGHLYEDKGDWQTAVHAYDNGCYYVDRGKNGCPAAGRLYLAHEQYQLAIQRYQTSLIQLPDWTPAKRGLVEALLALGRTEEALPYLRDLAASGDTDAQQKLDAFQTTP